MAKPTDSAHTQPQQMLVADADRPREHLANQSNPLHSDAHSPQPEPSRALIPVAVGVLIRADGAFLLTTRPPGKAYAGYWEFPGGKIEAGESVEQALRRELEEEIGVIIGPVKPWKTLQVDYPHAWVQLHFCQVRDWVGEPIMREGQQSAWQHLPVQVSPVLPGTLPVLDWLS